MTEAVGMRERRRAPEAFLTSQAGATGFSDKEVVGLPMVEWGGLTQRHQKSTVFQHHLLVQGPLGRVQLPPFLLGKSYGHIIEGHRYLESQTEVVALALGLLDGIRAHPYIPGKDAE